MTDSSTPTDTGPNSKTLVLCCGMIRSASTLQYQVVAELVERNGIGGRAGFADQQSVSAVLHDAGRIPGLAIIKVHEVLPELDRLIQQGRAHLFYTFRDLRAVALSIMRKWNVPFAHVIARKGWLETAVQSSVRWFAVPEVCVSRYEDMVLALPGEIAKWASALGLNISSGQAEELAGEFSIARQKERVETIRIEKPSDAGDYIDAKSLLHHDHILDGSFDSWKTELEQWQIRQIEHRFAEWQSRHGYQPISRP